MKTARKVMLLIMCAVLLVCTTIAGTVAYLKSTSEVAKNTFTVGDVKIKLDEALVDIYGNPIKQTAGADTEDTDDDVFEKVSLEEADRVLENSYKLLPGHSYVKDPMVTVLADSEESYIRMQVILESADYNTLKEVFPEWVVDGVFLLQNLVGGWDANTWASTGKITTKTIENVEYVVYEFRYFKTVDTLNGEDLELKPLFTSVVMPEDIDNNTIAKLKGIEIDIVAHAIQADGFDGDVDAAWEAFGE